jgi:hypothetical protein
LVVKETLKSGCTVISAVALALQLGSDKSSETRYVPGVFQLIPFGFWSDDVVADASVPKSQAYVAGVAYDPFGTNSKLFPVMHCSKAGKASRSLKVPEVGPW